MNNYYLLVHIFIQIIHMMLNYIYICFDCLIIWNNYVKVITCLCQLRNENKSCNKCNLF